MPLASARHDCPGQCGIRVTHAMLACAPCWARLPADLRHAVARADAIKRRSPADSIRVAEHRRAVVACLTWYRQNTGATS